MNLLDALKEVDKGHKVTCHDWNWQANGITCRTSYIFKTEGSKELGYYCGLKDVLEVIEVDILIDWLILDKAGQHDWEILE